MIKNKLVILLFCCFSLFHNDCTFAMEIEEDFFSIGQNGHKLYEEGDYKQAAPLLKRAIEGGQVTFALPYADICYRNLDKGKHPLKEAALWYIRASDSGDGDASSYLGSLSVALLNQHSENERVRDLVHLWAHEFANNGFELYKEGRYAEAAKQLKRAAQENHCLAQQLYGDICLRQLDGKPHSYFEAAMWYLLSAKGGDPQSLSYLKSLVPKILESEDYEPQIRAIIGCWVMTETLSTLKPTTPDHINGYIRYKHDRSIDRTTAQKLPYLFERIASGIICYLTGRTHSVIDDQLFPTFDLQDVPPDVRSCALSSQQESERRMVKPRLVPYVFGSVFVKYLQSLDHKLENGLLKKPPNLPEVSPLYALLLDALYESTQSLRAKALSQISHRDYPWLWAGIMFWKEKYSQPFDFTSLSEAELLRRLTELSDPISERDISKILEKVESEDVWPNDKNHPVSKQFNERMRVYFTTSLSRQERVVQKTETAFYTKLRAHDIDCSLKERRDVLKSGFLMFYCRELTLRNLASNSACLSALTEAQRYFVDLDLKVSLASNFNENTQTGQRIIALLKKLHKKGINVTIL